MEREQPIGPSPTGASQMEIAARAAAQASTAAQMGMMAPTATPPLGVPQYWLTNLLVAIESTMPMSEVVHSLHTQVLSNAALRDLPAVQAFGEISLRHLHAKVAVAGYIRRILAGDTAPATIAGMREQVEAYHRTHTEMGSNLKQVLGETTARENPFVQSIHQVMGMMDHAHQSIQSLIRPLIAVPAPAPAPAQ